MERVLTGAPAIAPALPTRVAVSIRRKRAACASVREQKKRNLQPNCEEFMLTS